MATEKKQDVKETAKTTEPGFKPPIAGAEEPMLVAMRELTPLPPQPVAPDFDPDPEPEGERENTHWAEGSTPPEFSVLSDLAREVAIHAANAAYADGQSEKDAITNGVIFAQEWGKSHKVSIRK